MPKITGPLKYVTGRASEITEVWVRARELRTVAGGVVTTTNDRAAVIEGQVSFDALPGPAIMVLVEAGRPVDTIPIIVGDAPAQSLETVVRAAEVASDAQQDVLEDLAIQVAQDAEAARANRVAAEEARDKAQEAQEKAEGAAESAAQDATDAVEGKLSGLVNDAQAAADASADAARVEVAKVVDGAPESLDTLREIADKLAAQDDVAAALTSQIAGKADKGYVDGIKARTTNLETVQEELADDLNLKANKADLVPTKVVSSMPSSPAVGTLYLVTGS